MEYGHWVEEQNRQTCELRAALQANVADAELHMLVESGMRHYDNLFQIKAIAAKSDAFYLMSGMWRTPTERFFLWIGGFRPSKLLKVLNMRLFLEKTHHIINIVHASPTVLIRHYDVS